MTTFFGPSWPNQELARIDSRLQCEDGAACVHQNPAEREVTLQYGSIRIKLTSEECRQLNQMVRAAASKLYKIFHLDTSSGHNQLGLQLNGTKAQKSHNWYGRETILQWRRPASIARYAVIHMASFASPGMNCQSPFRRLSLCSWCNCWKKQSLTRS